MVAVPPAFFPVNLATRLGMITAIAGAVAVAAALVVLWSIRLDTLPRSMYVSEFGAEGEATAALFEVALLLIVAGGVGTAIVARGILSTPPVLRAWRPAMSLLVASGFFLIASQVTCTAGCPLPVGATFTWQDFVHTLCAVLAFAAACWGMLQLSFAHGHRGLARFSLVSALAVGLIAGTGGILSLARFGTDVGSWLELVATTIALCWLLVTALAVSMPALSARDVTEPARGPLVFARTWRR